MRSARRYGRLPDEFSSPQNLANFLASSGWELAASDATRMTWQLPGDGRRRTTLMLPLDSTFVDFEERLEEAVAQLCDVNAWDLDELLAHIVQSRSDLLLIRADQATFADSIPLKQAESLLSGSAEMLLAAARAAISPRPQFRGNYPEMAKDFLDRDVRMGHTRRGSFILTIVTSLEERESTKQSQIVRELPKESPIDSAAQLAPIESADQPAEAEQVVGDQSSISDTIEPSAIEIASPNTASPVATSQSSESLVPTFQRRVMTTLAGSLAATRELTQSQPTISIDDAVARGVSSNLLESLDQMSAFEGLRALDMTFQWSNSQRIVPATPTSIILPHASFVEFKARAKSLKAAPSTHTETIYGRVVRVDVDDDQHQLNEGVFTVRGVTENSDSQSARMTVSGQNYARVYRALRSRKLIIVTGTLEKIKGVWWMTGDIEIENVPDRDNKAT